VEDHIQVCPACARQLRWVSTLKAAVRGAPRPALPAELRAELMKKAREAGALHTSWLDSWRFSWRWAAGFGFASAFAAVVAVLVFGRFSTGTEELSLDEVLEAHSRYQLTMPVADREAIFTDLGLQLSQGGGSRG
jgi:anti-sigma factor RsiW